MSDDGFHFLDDDPEPDVMHVIDLPFLDKTAIFVKPKQPLIDWINNLDPENPMDLKNFFEGNTYLFSSEEYDISYPEDIDILL